MSIDELTILRAIAAFCVAGVYVVAMTAIAERFGSKVGGLVLALPSVVVIGVIFIAISKGNNGLHEAAAIMPATIAAATIFPIMFNHLARWGSLASFSGAVAAWLTITTPLAAAKISDIRLSLTISAALFVLAILSFRHTPHRSVSTLSQSRRTKMMRFIVAGLIAGITVIAARFAGPLWGAVCASFPAVVAISLYVISRSHGIEFTSSVGRTMITGCMAGVVFAFSLYVFSSALGSAVTIFLAYCCSVMFAIFAHRFLIEGLGSSNAKV